MRPICFAGFILSLCLGLAGCGQKGPLYMPSPEFPAPTKQGPGSLQDPTAPVPVKPGSPLK
ncbi:MAG: lipoprotein [Proteobacteria bacterium]|nr:lipoprotein [Pseudomonadota bacterium]MDP4618780.1 lipoprotein [Burkholderiaceae bacterium]HCO56960.1 hypothetical protein [Burkholderiales bacterium]MDP4677247.1 lipoprotein [Burkholderiaceae bacterium]MDP4741733.1 lipoprotein [Burkholderiaceae bacterium]